MSETFRSEFGDDNSEFGGRVNSAFDGSSEGPSGGGAATTASPERPEGEELDEEFEMVDGKRAITLQVTTNR